MIDIKKQHLTRQMDIIPIKSLNRTITVIGAGAIGSHTVFDLTKMGYEDITVIDFDKVDIENINSQLYRFKDVGRPKVEALKEIIKDFCGVEINIINDKYKDEVFKDIVICAVDNMKTRKSIYENHKKKGLLTNLIIDPRMAIEFAMIQSYNPLDIEETAQYEKTLYSDENAIQETCTGKSTGYTAKLIGATICKIVKDLANDKPFLKNLSWDIACNEISLAISSTGKKIHDLL